MAWSFHNGLGVYRFGQGESIFLTGRTATGSPF
jgi:hypothetical protein